MVAVKIKGRLLRLMAVETAVQGNLQGRWGDINNHVADSIRNLAMQILDVCFV